MVLTVYVFYTILCSQDGWELFTPECNKWFSLYMCSRLLSVVRTDGICLLRRFYEWFSLYMCSKLLKVVRTDGNCLLRSVMNGSHCICVLDY